MLIDNRYRLGPQIGRGGMAIVHAATDIRLRRPVAVTLFHPGADEVTLARLQAEAQLLAGLSHPGLLRVFDVCLTGERPYPVLELVTGTTLRTLINTGRLEPKLVARLGARLAGTIQYVHSRHILHRDIKPSNVLLDRAGECYLADFGIARAFGAAMARLSHSPEVPRRIPPDLRQTLIDMTARDSAAALLAAGAGLAILLPGDTTASTPPVQPAAPPAQPVDPAPAVDLVPRTAVGHLVAPAAERQPPAGEAKKSRKKGRGDGEKPDHDESGEGWPGPITPRAKLPFRSSDVHSIGSGSTD